MSFDTDTTPPAPKNKQERTEYLLVADKTSEVIKSETGAKGLSEIRKLAGTIRRAGGEVTVFKSMDY